ncbi:MAG: hypothetical protein PHS97_04050 [Oscillospiraceae bacterium]|nr:hypothetical protein [Oscillospiraceae bacterium]
MPQYYTFSSSGLHQPNGDSVAVPPEPVAAPQCPPQADSFPPHPESAPESLPPESSDGDCRQGLVQVLQLLKSSACSAFVDYHAFAFVTQSLIQGAHPIAECAEESGDNLSALSGSFRRFSPQTQHALDTGGAVYAPIPAADGVEILASADRVFLQQLRAIVFSLLPSTTEDACKTVRAMLSHQMADGSHDRTVSLTAGALAVHHAVLLSAIDGVLVLTCDARRFYLVCADQVSFLGE